MALSEACGRKTEAIGDATSESEANSGQHLVGTPARFEDVQLDATVNMPPPRGAKAGNWLSEAFPRKPEAIGDAMDQSEAKSEHRPVGL